ncbi:MAG TPA: hypothetical protein VIC87_13295, partial [Vicinamibacteria bacterium]
MKTRLPLSWPVLLTVLAGVGFVAALSVPSLLRARVAVGPLPKPFERPAPRQAPAPSLPANSPASLATPSGVEAGAMLLEDVGAAAG